MRIIVAVPLVAVVGFAGVALAGSARGAEQASALGVRVQLAAQAGSLAYRLQLERAAAADLLAAESTPRAEGFTRQSRQTDRSIASYLDQRRQVEDASAGTHAILERVDRALAGLASLRAQVRTAAQASVSAVAFSYRILIADLLAYRESIAQGVSEADLADDIRAAAEVSKMAESVGQQQVAVLRAVAAGQLTPAMQQDITASRTGFTEASLSFLGLARPSWRLWWEQAGSGQDALALQRLQDQVSRTRAGTRLRLDPEAWISTTQAWGDRLFSVQQRIDAAVLSDVRAARVAQRRQAAGEGAAMAAAVLLTLTVTWAVARQITRRLRRLRDDANTVAFARLPAMVAELRTAAGGQLDPDALAAESALEPGGAVNDEIGEVGQAFTAVHRAAVRTAAEQAVMRANTAEIFVHLSRREQRLVDAVLAQVDLVERDETDPERLDQLYTLDHLATRMARINASLLVLGGVGVARVRSGDVTLSSVLQAALSQIEHYTRVRLGVVDEDVAVAYEAVDEVVHLLAELMDNATMYSPPDTEAWATARSLGDRVIVQICDEGVGLPPQRLNQLNRLLSAPPATDVAAVRAMGLVVVGQLAARLGVGVELRPGPKLGTIAEVTLPSTLIRATPSDLELPMVGRSPAALPASLQPVVLSPEDAMIARSAPAIIGPPNRPAAPAFGGNGRSNGHRRRPGEARRPSERAQVHPQVHPQGHSQTPTQPYPSLPAGPAGPAQPGPGRPAPPQRPPRQNPLAQQNPLAPQNRPAQQARPGRPAPPAPRVLTADQTQELPIFQQVNSWFRAGHPDEPAWKTPADEGWRTALEVAAAEVTTTTSKGLPQRVPQSHLVPGRIDDRPAATMRRDPSRVAAAMSAYARGVAARRPALVNSSPSTDPTGSAE
jgi:HAMP domain-containing protein